MKTIFSTFLALFLTNITIGQSVVTRSSILNTDKTTTDIHSTYACPITQMPAPIDLFKVNENTDGWSDGLRFAIFNFPRKTYYTNDAFLQGTFMGHGLIQSHNICLTVGKSYMVVAPDIMQNDDEIGMLICNTVYIEPGEMAQIRMTEKGCKAIPADHLNMQNSQQTNQKNDKNLEHPTPVHFYIPVQSYQSANTYSLSMSQTLSKSYSQSTSPTIYPSPEPYSFSNSMSRSISMSTSFCSPSPTISSQTPSPSLNTNSPTTNSPTTTDTTTSPTTNSPTTNSPTTNSPNPSTFPTTNYPPPTFSPVNFPTPEPSLDNQPSPSPTIQTLPVAQFKTEIMLSVSSNAPYDSQTELAICSATAKTLSIDPSTCKYDGTIFTQTSRRNRRNRRKLIHILSTFNAASSLSIVVMTANPAIFFAAASSNLAAAASSGSFTANLQSECQSLGVVNAVSSATVTGASASGLVIILPPTQGPTQGPIQGPTQGPTQNNGQNVASKKLLSAGDIAAATIMSVFGCVMLFFGLYWYHYNYLQIIYDSNPYSNVNTTSAVVTSCNDDNDIIDGQDKTDIDLDNTDVALLVDVIPTEPVLTNENGQNDIINTIVESHTIVESPVDNNDINIEIKNDYEIVVQDE